MRASGSRRKRHRHLRQRQVDVVARAAVLDQAGEATREAGTPAPKVPLILRITPKVRHLLRRDELRSLRLKEGLLLQRGAVGVAEGAAND